MVIRDGGTHRSGLARTVLRLALLGVCSGALILTAAMAGEKTINFEINPAGDNNPISPLIYGINSFETSGVLSERFVYRRLGGNRTSGYNWETNASNAGADWHHQNDDYLSKSAEPAAAVLDPMRITLAKGGSVLVTVPMTDHLAADKRGDGDIAKTPDFTHTRLVSNFARRGTPFPATPDLSDNAVYQDEFVAYLKTKLPTAFASGPGRVMFSLDNEADLWHSTHPRLLGATGEKAEPMAAQPFFERSAAFAAAIKSVAPTSLVFGPASYGWAGMRSFQNAEKNQPDFLDSYLAYMREAEKTSGHRLLDVLDIHWYPSDQVGDKGIGGTESDPAIQFARMNAPRSLWDKRFVEPSWIGKWSGAVQLIPRLKGEVAKNYPGTAIAITEYNYGGPADISGGIAEADVLGIFGREGVFAANHWPMANAWSYIYGGMAMFLNFDGKNGHFGDVSVSATADDTMTASIYASTVSSRPGRVIAVLINKNDEPIIAKLNIRDKVVHGVAHLYSLTDASSTPQDRGVLQASAANRFAVPMPKHSVLTLVAD